MTRVAIIVGSGALTGLSDTELAPLPRKRDGETTAQMRHVRNLKATGGPDGKPPDHSADERFAALECDRSLRRTDMYALATTVIWILPKVLAFILPLFLFALPLALPALHTTDAAVLKAARDGNGKAPHY